MRVTPTSRTRTRWGWQHTGIIVVAVFFWPGRCTAIPGSWRGSDCGWLQTMLPGSCPCAITVFIHHLPCVGTQCACPYLTFPRLLLFFRPPAMNLKQMFVLSVRTHPTPCSRWCAWSHRSLANSVKLPSNNLPSMGPASPTRSPKSHAMLWRASIFVVTGVGPAVHKRGNILYTTKRGQIAICSALHEEFAKPPSHQTKQLYTGHL